MTQNSYPKIKTCPFCDSEGCTGTYFDYLVNAWVTEFNCDEDDTHHCLIVRLPPSVVIKLKTIPKEKAKELIEDYIKNNEGKWTSDIVFDLELSVDLVLGVLEELVQEGIIEASDIQSSTPTARKEE